MFKKLLLTTALAAATAGITQAAPVQYGNRDFYGFFLSNEGFDNGAYGFAKLKFSNSMDSELLYPFTGNKGIYAGTAIDGVFYVIPYTFASSMQMPNPDPVLTYNIYTGEVNEIGEWNPEQTQFKPQDLTYDILNDRLLAIGYDPEEQCCIYEVDRKTGKFTRILHLPLTGGTLAADAHGRLFMISNDGLLYQIDTTTDNRVTYLATLPFSGMYTNQTMEFDHTTNKLYWGATCTETPIDPEDDAEQPLDKTQSWLTEITLPTIGPSQNYTSTSGEYSVNVVEQIGFTSRFLAMYIPYCAGGFGAPGFATNVSAKGNENGSACEITFTAPTKCFNGEDDTEVNGYDIYREGVRIHTGKDIQAGQTVTYTDNTVPASGTYRYDIVCYSNTGGDGPKTPLYTYVGYDRPAAVPDCNVTTSADFSSVSLSWTAPDHGAQGGTFYPEQTTYDITRLPDNVKVASDLTETSFEDKNIRRLLKYYYCITAKNQYGETSVNTVEVVAGPPYEDEDLPLEETFDNPTAFHNRWLSVDNNEDTFSWLYGSDLGHSVFGDYEMTAEYIISSTLGGVELIKDADEWIIAPPITFEEGKDYYATISIRSLTNELFRLHVGDKCSVEGMQLVDSFTLKEPAYDDETGHMLFQNYRFKLPESVAGTTKCVGLQLATPVPPSFYGYVQVGQIVIGDQYSAVENITDDSEGASFTVAGDIISIQGVYSDAALYDMNGVKVAAAANGSISMSGLAHGVYVLTIDGASHKIAR